MPALPLSKTASGSAPGNGLARQPTRLTRKRLTILLALIFVGGIVAAALDLRFVIGGAARRVEPNSLLVLDARTLDTLANPRGPRPRPPRVVRGAGLVWTLDSRNNRLIATNPVSRSVFREEVVGTDPVAVAIGFGAAWVANAGNGSITRVPLDGSKIETLGLNDSALRDRHRRRLRLGRQQGQRQGDPDRPEDEAGRQVGAARQPAARRRGSVDRPGRPGDRRLTRFRHKGRRTGFLGWSGGVERRPAAGGRGCPRAGLHPRGCGLGQDDHDHASDREPGRLGRVPAVADPRGHVHGQGGGRDEGAARAARRVRRPRARRSIPPRWRSSATSGPTRSEGSWRRRRSWSGRSRTRSRRRTSSVPPATSRPRSSGRTTAASRRSVTWTRWTSMRRRSRPT